jgi:hypothetical protein
VAGADDRFGGRLTRLENVPVTDERDGTYKASLQELAAVTGSGTAD